LHRDGGTEVVAAARHTRVSEPGLWRMHAVVAGRNRVAGERASVIGPALAQPGALAGRRHPRDGDAADRLALRIDEDTGDGAAIVEHEVALYHRTAGDLDREAAGRRRRARR